MVGVCITNQTDEIDLFMMGGNGGGSQSLGKPLKIVGGESGKTLRLYGYNNSKHPITISISIHGYEI